MGACTLQMNSVDNCIGTGYHVAQAVDLACHAAEVTKFQECGLKSVSVMHAQIMFSSIYASVLLVRCAA